MSNEPIDIEGLIAEQREDHRRYHHPNDNHSDCLELRTANALAQLRDQRDKAIKERDAIARELKLSDAGLMSEMDAHKLTISDFRKEIGKLEARADAAEEVSAQLRKALEDQPCANKNNWPVVGDCWDFIAPAEYCGRCRALTATPTGRRAALEEALERLRAYFDKHIALDSYDFSYFVEEWKRMRDLADAALVATPTGRMAALEEALTLLYEETAEYIRINHLGDVHHNESMKKARAALDRK